VVPIENLKTLPPYDREKYREMTLDAAETVLGFFGFDRTIYSNPKRNNDGRRRKWDGVKVNSCMSILRK
jgi:hypothetical protein